MLHLEANDEPTSRHGVSLVAPYGTYRQPTGRSYEGDAELESRRTTNNNELASGYHTSSREVYSLYRRKMHCNTHWNHQHGVWSILLVVLLLASSTVAFSPTLKRSSSSSTRIFAVTLPEGVAKTISKPGQGNPVKLGDIATIKYTCYLPGNEKETPFAKSDKQKMVLVCKALGFGGL
jgi:multidrug efflux pump subunit AcrB